MRGGRIRKSMRIAMVIKAAATTKIAFGNELTVMLNTEPNSIGFTERSLSVSPNFDKKKRYSRLTPRMDMPTA